MKMVAIMKSRLGSLLSEAGGIMLKIGKITIDEVGKYFPELLECDIKEPETVMQLS